LSDARFRILPAATVSLGKHSHGRALPFSGVAAGRFGRESIEALIVTADWKPVAAAEVEFAGSRAFTKVMLPRFVVGRDSGSLHRAFPRYRTLWPEEG
jgi:hypothetical protein